MTIAWKYMTKINLLIYSIPDIYFYQEDDGDDGDGGKNTIISD